MKKVIVIITSAYHLLQVIWYHSIHPDYEYIAYVKTAGLNLEVKNKLLQFCKKSGVFSKIVETHTTDIESNLYQKAMLGIKMIAYFIIGKRKVLTKKIIAQEIGDINYDIVLVDSELSILGGAFIDFSDVKETIILQEGLSDLDERRTYPRLTFNDLVGFFMAKMGYCNFMLWYKMKKTVFCEKVLSHPEIAVYKQFKRTTKLFEMDETQQEIFNNTVKRAFSDVNWKVILEADVIIFTNTLLAFTDSLNYYDSLHKWLKQNMIGKKIVIKKHPRDLYQYNWPDLDISFVEESLPAEVLIPHLEGQEIILMYFSTIILDVIDSDKKYKILLFEDIEDKEYMRSFRYFKSRLKIENKYIGKL